MLSEFRKLVIALEPFFDHFSFMQFYSLKGNTFVKRRIIMKTYTRRLMFALPFYGGAISGDKDRNINHARLKN